MPFRLPQAPTFLQKYWRVVLVAIIFIIVASFVMWFVNRAQTRTEDMKKLTMVQSIRSNLELYYLSRNDYPPAADTTTGRFLGQEDAICLDKSDEGLRNVCDSELLIARRLPREDFIYQKTAVGDYLLTFQLQKRVGSLLDVNQDGKIECRADKSGIQCQ